MMEIVIIMDVQAGAAHKGVPLYRHIADLAGVKTPSSLLFPSSSVFH